jgi:hypothetical protein
MQVAATPSPKPSSPGGPPLPLIHRAPIPLDVTNFALDQLRQTAVNVVAQPAEEEA